ncbi:bacterial Ig-like domain-containing protein, partial [Leuconostoc falkenbergense]|uniref:bacterial Ig-like domain-containing protein n=1 Tax=Leuconostoc falkenbergense TaxID=2766470 RepID=UPI0024ACE951
KWTAGDNFISATDQAGNAVELKDIQVSGSVDTNKAGKYEITYSYTDASGNLVSKTITVTVLAPSSDSGSKSSISKTPDSPTVKVSYRVTKNNNNGNKQLPDTGEKGDGVVGSIVGAIFAASLGILTIINKRKNDN